MEVLGSEGAGAIASGAVDRTPISNGAAARVTPAPDHCPDAWLGLRFYRSRYNEHREGIGADTTWPVGRRPLNCPDARQLAKVWRVKAKVARVALGRYLREQHAQWNWQGWLPRLWYAIGMCETHLDWHFDSGTYVSAFGIIRSAFPGWNGNNSPREQYRVALDIANRYGLGAWGCYSHGGYRYHLR